MLERVLPASMLQSTSPKVFDQPALESSGIIPVEAKSDGDELVSKSSVVVETREVGPSLPLSSSNIKSSPYHDPRNFLNLDELSTPVRLFALALTKFEPLRPDYATSPYMATFNFDAIFGTLRDLCQDAGIEWKRQEFYVVIFRSKLRESADRVRLGELDQMSHQEACASGGLLHYWFGSPDSEIRNLATCIWRNREDAAAGGRGPWHRKARGAAREMYTSISFHTHMLIVEDGASSWKLEEHHD